MNHVIKDHPFKPGDKLVFSGEGEPPKVKVTGKGIELSPKPAPGVYFLHGEARLFNPSTRKAEPTPTNFSFVVE